MEAENSKKNFLVKFGYWAAILLIGLVFIKFLLRPLTPFIIAFIIAAVLQPLINKLAKPLKLKRNILALILVLLTYILLVCIIALVIFGVISALINWAGDLPLLFSNTISPWLTEMVGNIEGLIDNLSLRFGFEFSLDSLLADSVSTISSSVVNFSGNIVSWASSVGSKLPGAMLATVICVIATVFWAGDYDNIFESTLKILPSKIRETVEFMRKAFRTIIGGYARSYLLILLITFIEIGIGLMIIGVDDAFLIALLISFLDFLPIVGSGMVLMPWTIVSFIQGNILRGIGLGILWLIVVVVRQIIEPKIVGKQVGMHPLMTLICMWVGLKLYGGVGMLALPVSVLLIMHLKVEGLIFSGSADVPAAPDTENVVPSPICTDTDLPPSEESSAT